jgi:hypothetical protein
MARRARTPTILHLTESLHDTQNQPYNIKVAVKTRMGFQATVYELTSRAYLAIIFDSSSLDNLLERMGEDVASEILIAISGLTR